MNNNLTTQSRFSRVANAAAAGQTAVNSSAVDMTGFDAVTFIVSFGAITSGGAQSIKVQTSSDNSNWNDLTGTSIAVSDTDDSKIVVSEISNPREQYLRCVVSRATQDSVVDGIVAIQTKHYSEPITQDSATVVSAELHHAPAEGTA